MSQYKSNNMQHCDIQGCKSSMYNKPLGTSFHQLPTSAELKRKWQAMLNGRCSTVEWSKIKICSKHFENKYFNSSRKLKDNAVPTIFPPVGISKSFNYPPRTKVDKLLNRLSQQELINNITDTMSLINVPDNFSDCVDDDLQCNPDTPVEAQLWLLIKKQDHLITRMTQIIDQNQKHVEVLQKNMEESRSAKKSMEQSVESYKYIVKCLQEKHATLEEQIEILTAVESR